MFERFIRKLPAVHTARHDHVGEQEIDLVTTVDDLKRLGGIRRRQGDTTEARNLSDNLFADQFIVFNNEDRFMTAAAQIARTAGSP